MRYYVGKDTTQRERQKHPPWKDSEEGSFAGVLLLLLMSCLPLMLLIDLFDGVFCHFFM